ncbi:MAG: glycosyl hydrolase family 39 [Ferruginibacter sp.]
MMKKKVGSNTFKPGMLLCVICLLAAHLSAQNNVTINWDQIVRESKTTPTLQVVVNPRLVRGANIHGGSFNALKNLGADYVRFVPWFPYPHMAVAELKPPTDKETFWDFSKIDPIVEDFMNATQGHSVTMNFSTIPNWMFKTDQPVVVPADANQVFWDYNGGTELRDTTMKELVDYFVNLLSWYTKGGFTDELGKYYPSTHHYNFSYWEVLNEPDLEHNISPQLYTKMYDAIVTGMKKVAPETKFIGLSLAYSNNPEWFEYFLNPANHTKGIEPEGISYHFYGEKNYDLQNIDTYQYSFFNQADGFLNKVRYIESIRKRLSPKTFTTINEIGNILSRDGDKPISPAYWNLSGAMYAYIYVVLANIGIDVAGESQLVGYPTQFPSVSMMNWITGKPNSRFWVLKLLKDNFGPGDKLVAANVNTALVKVQGFITGKGKKLLLINKSDKPVQLMLPADAKNATVQYVDGSTADNPPAQRKLQNNQLLLKPFAVAVIQF